MMLSPAGLMLFCLLAKNFKLRHSLQMQQFLDIYMSELLFINLA